MIETDEQRRWWFATHPEYSWSRKRTGSKREDKEAKQRDYSQEDVDAYVAKGLKYYPTGPVAALLQALKWGLGTNEGPTPLDALFKTTDADRSQSDSSELSNEKKDESERETTLLENIIKGIDNTFRRLNPLDFGLGQSAKGELKRAQLPTQGKIRYVPPDNWHPSEHLPRGPNKGYMDKFGNEWVKGTGRGSDRREWDVQLGKNASDGLRAMSKDGKHVNVSMKGEITH
jgi:hypothetical protein